MSEEENDRAWGIGELAAAIGVTVRTLRHNDEIGLLAASERSEGGRRRYTAPNVKRLHLIVALRRLGLRLVDIAAMLDDDLVPEDVVRRQLEDIEESIAGQQRLRRELHGLLATFSATTGAALINLIEETNAMEYLLTPEQQRELTHGRQRMFEG